MKENFSKALPVILTYEGGYANNPKDPGGATMKGITQGTYNAWLARQGLASTPVRNISDKDVETIYQANYWAKLDCDEMPSGVDLCLFDAAVNSGVGSSTSWAQAVCGVTVDGDFGMKTKAAIQSMDPETFIRDFNSRRLATLKRLPTWGTFGKGWAARISNGQKIEIAWAEAGDGPDAVMVDTVGGNAKANPSAIPVSRTRVIVANATTVGGAVAAGVSQTTQAISGVSFPWVTNIVGGLTLVGALAALIVYLSKTWDDKAAAGTAKATVDPNADADIPTKATVAAKAVALAPQPVAQPAPVPEAKP